MSDDRGYGQRFSPIKSQMRRAVDDHDRDVRIARVERVLGLLNSDSLISQAASGLADEDNSLLLECNIAPLVWDDPRVAYRLRQLEGSGITVELVDHESEIAGKIFKRTKIRVSFQS
jgi:hypothetical protein